MSTQTAASKLTSRNTSCFLYQSARCTEVATSHQCACHPLNMCHPLFCYIQWYLHGHSARHGPTTQDKATQCARLHEGRLKENTFTWITWIKEQETREVSGVHERSHHSHPQLLRMAVELNHETTAWHTGRLSRTSCQYVSSTQLTTQLSIRVLRQCRLRLDTCAGG